ncbi:MAG: signal peptidase I [Microbacterium sp.]|uniref:signal peptidase I n=1 Tax=Microbacterium sp. TaxID=51671 RepID=UPI001AC57585|nr:signal peptidase I [Microbacterium sp.]MBN9152530.1 signal peptidase I [Microbacterium sp.]
MGALRRVALGILWLLAGIGIVSGVMWGLTAAGIVKPLVVISGSMEPKIMTGDLVIDTKVPASSLKIGDVVSLPSQLTHNLVTHRIQKIVSDGGDTYTITLKGDANQFQDALDYTVAGEVWMPKITVPAVGNVIMRMTTPAVAVPLLVGLVGLMGITWLLPAPSRRDRTRHEQRDPQSADASVPVGAETDAEVATTARTADLVGAVAP